MLKRALLRGSTAVLHPTFGAIDIAKAMIAVPAYAIALPVALLAGHHRFMSLLIKLFDHVGKLLALLGIDLVNVQYVTE
jgi:succinoglycan biosynthesis protein ExoM